MNITTIYNAANTRLDTILTGYNRLVNVFDIEANPDPAKHKGYAVKWGASRNTPGMTRHVTLDQDLIVTLINTVPVRFEDNLNTEVNSLYTDIGTVLTDFMNATKLGVPNSILGVLEPTISDPILTADRMFVYFNITFIMKYREDI